MCHNNIDLSVIPCIERRVRSQRLAPLRCPSRAEDREVTSQRAQCLDPVAARLARCTARRALEPRVCCEPRSCWRVARRSQSQSLSALSVRCVCAPVRAERRLSAVSRVFPDGRTLRTCLCSRLPASRRYRTASRGRWTPQEVSPTVLLLFSWEIEAEGQLAHAPSLR
jgi:hypothetical protein